MLGLARGQVGVEVPSKSKPGEGGVNERGKWGTTGDLSFIEIWYVEEEW